MRKAFLFFILPGIVFVMGAIFWAVERPWLLTKVARATIERSLPDIRVQQLSISRQHLTPSGRLSIDGVFCSALVKGQPLMVKVDHAEVTGLGTLLSFQRRLQIHIAGAEIDLPPGKAAGVRAEVVLSQDRKGFLIDGPVRIERVTWDKIRFEDVSARLQGDRQALEFQHIQAIAYGGMVTADARIVFLPLSYVVTTRLEGIDTWRLADINDQLAAQLAGRIFGAMSVSGDAVQVTHLTLALDMPDGGQVNAALLSTLTQYLPQSREKKRLAALIKIGGKLAVEVFSFTIQSEKLDHLSGEVKLKSREANLELNLNHDILTDGTWDGLAQYWQSLLR